MHSSFLPFLKFTITVALLIGWCVNSKASITLSDSARISLITCSPGAELYSCFGHTGIRVTDFKQQFDIVFNYGTFDFERPDFYTNFIKGLLIYMVDVDRFERFKMQYEYEERSVTEQVLNLNDEQRKSLFRILDDNVQPQNRNYRYDFFWNNCATRPRDVIESVVGDKLKYNFAGFDSSRTMHDLLREYVHDRPWVDFGFDLILGMPCEVKALPRYQMFLPDYLSKAFAGASVDNLPLVSQTNHLLTYPQHLQAKMTFTPLLLSCVISLVSLLIIVWGLYNGREVVWLSNMLLFSTGLLGIFFLSVWLFTDHYSTRQNMNLLWLVPFNFIVFFVRFTKWNSKLKGYYLVLAVLAVFQVLFWKWLPQPLNLAVLPLLFLLIVQYYSMYKYSK